MANPDLSSGVPPWDVLKTVGAAIGTIAAGMFALLNRRVDQLERKTGRDIKEIWDRHTAVADADQKFRERILEKFNDVASKADIRDLRAEIIKRSQERL